MNRNILESILTIFNKFSLQQKVLIGLTTGITIALLGTLIFFLNEPNYSPLYSNLSQEDAANVIDYLNTQKIAYQIDDEGKTIKVSKDKVYETRLSLAAKGIPSSGIIGYEIFDKNTMGMSEFMQKLNYKRALEGELSRTIMEQNGVEGVRVHIVIPEKSIFKDEEKQPTASVVLKLKSNYSITKNNIAAIVNLVSSSVEGLTPGNVTLIDTRGRILSKDYNDEPLAYSGTKQYEMKQSVENYLAQKAQSILDNILGFGNSMIQVNADLDFNQVERTMTLFDPESQVAISEQSIKTENNGKNLGDSTAQVSQNNTTNYEINKTIQRVVEGSGNIKRLSVAAVINDIPKEVKKGDKTEIVYEPRPADQIKKLEEIIRNAVGVDEKRNDQFSIVNISFETKPVEDVETPAPTFIDHVDDYTNIILILLSIGGAIFVLKGLMSKLKNQRMNLGNIVSNGGLLDTYKPQTLLQGSKKTSQPPITAGKKRQMLPIGDIEDEISDEAARKKNQQDKIANYVSKNPVDTAKLINSWLHEDEV
jgi:flagellar M-ring protein FliF